MNVTHARRSMLPDRRESLSRAVDLTDSRPADNEQEKAGQPAMPGDPYHPRLPERVSANDAGTSEAGSTVDDPTAQPAGKTSPVPQVPGYEILGTLGRGGMGIVYKARQIKLNRLVALKMVLDGPQVGADAFKRFQLEAEAVPRLQHPNIVEFYEVDHSEQLPYFSFTFLLLAN